MADMHDQEYDPQRVALFDRLFTVLRDTTLPYRPDRAATWPARTNAAWWDALFSCDLEGVNHYTIEDAWGAVFRQEVEGVHPDHHDLDDLFRILDDTSEMHYRPRRFVHFIDTLKSRHALVMRSHSDVKPGEFKVCPNQAGGHKFVVPELVQSTLRFAFQRYRQLRLPFARALFIHYILVETHPFRDGNGRTARMFMNAELIAAGQSRILLPPAVKHQYISALKELSMTGKAESYINTMATAQDFTASIDFDNIQNSAAILQRRNAFVRGHGSERLIWPGQK
jgi:hypothetical protein